MSTPKQVFQKRPWRLKLGERRSLLIIGDLLVGILSLFIALYLWGLSERFSGFSIEFLQKRVPFWFYFLPLVWIILMVELYDIHRAAEWGKTVRNVAAAAVLGIILYLALYFYYVSPPNSLLPRFGVASFFIAVTFLTLFWRWLFINIFRLPRFMRKVLLVGGGLTGEALLKVLNGLKSRPFVLVGIVDDDHRKLGTFIQGYQVIGNSENLLKLIEENEISDIIVGITAEVNSTLFQSLLQAQEAGIEITRMPVIYEELLGRIPVQYLESNWILRTFADEAHKGGFYELGKRFLDIIGGIVGFLLLLLVSPIVALIILIDDGFPVIYAQTRAGRGGQPYTIFKFRTMRKDAEADGRPRWAKEDDERATRSGRFLRKTHLDELPQFINVIKGEMSLVGPRAERPELMNVFEKHIQFYRARLIVKPGITGWAQINFGYASSVEETSIKLEYDLYYIKHRSMLNDLIIMLRTPATVLGFRGR